MVWELTKHQKLLQTHQTHIPCPILTVQPQVSAHTKRMCRLLKAPLLVHFLDQCVACHLMIYNILYLYNNIAELELAVGYICYMFHWHSFVIALSLFRKFVRHFLYLLGSGPATVHNSITNRFYLLFIRQFTKPYRLYCTLKCITAKC